MNLKKAADEYLLYLEANGRHPRTLYTYGKDLEQIRAFFGDSKKLHNITKAQVSGFLESDDLLSIEKSGKRRAERTINKTVRVLRMLLFWACAQGLIAEVPLPDDVPLGRNAA
jgi:site-specific recombinase XerD